MGHLEHCLRTVTMRPFRAVAMHCSLLLAVLSLSGPSSFATDTGGALYRQRCAPCHAKNGQGSPGIKAPSLVSEKVRKMSDDDLRAMISQRTNGEMERDRSHTRLKKRLTADQAGEIVGYIREMQSRSTAR
jgi:mono/diheme cytochrome c family protein